MPGIPLAGPPAMAPPTPVTEPGVQRSVTVPPSAVAVVRIMSAPPLCSDTSSENGGTGRSSGTSTSAMSEPWSTATTDAGRTPAGSHHVDVAQS